MSGQILEYRNSNNLPMELSLTRQLLIDIEQSRIVQADRERASLHVIDWIGCAALGAKSRAGKVYAAMLEASPMGSCTGILAVKSDWQNVVQYNSALGNVLEMDDIHRSSILHPGPVVIPAALAIAEYSECSAECFLDAIIKGYEVTIRIGQAIGRSHYQYFHNTSTCAAFGAAMAAAHILDLNLEQSLSALGNAGSRTGGFWQMRNESVMSKQWHNAEAARSGAMAAFMAEKGLTGPEFILEGPQGLFNATSQDAIPQLVVQQCENWQIYGVSFKPWPACRHAHPAIDVLQDLIAINSLEPQKITEIELATYSDALLFCDKPNPTTELEAKFSVQHALAAVLCWGEPQLAHYQIDVLDHPDLVEKRSMVTLIQNERLESNYPEHYGARCTVTLDSGESMSLEHLDTLGDPERPLSRARVTEKARLLMTEAGMKSVNIKSVLKGDWRDAENVRTLTGLLGKQDDDYS